MKTLLSAIFPWGSLISETNSIMAPHGEERGSTACQPPLQLEALTHTHIHTPLFFLIIFFFFLPETCPAQCKPSAPSMVELGSLSNLEATFQNAEYLLNIRCASLLLCNVQWEKLPFHACPVAMGAVPSCKFSIVEYQLGHENTQGNGLLPAY